MTRITFKTASAVLVVAAAVCLCFALAACTPQDSPSDSGSGSNSNSSAGTGTETNISTSDSTGSTEPGAYVSDEQCLSCHGESYEALAETTSSYGDWNPHDSIHGGYNSCVNCHAKDKELTHNRCEDCHAWDPTADAA